MTQTVFAPTEHYTSVSTLIANLKAAQRRKASPKPAIEVGARVNVPALGIAGKLVAVKPSSVSGGVTVFRIGWLEGKEYREAGFWLEDIEVVGAAENAADGGKATAALSA